MENSFDQGKAPSDMAAAARPMRSDARRSLDALLQAAREVFATSGVDAPVREIAGRAGVGLGTVYRHFPERAGLIAAVFRREIDECADAAIALAAEHEPADALARWLQRLADFFLTKRGLAGALHSGDEAFAALPGHFDRRLRPALDELVTMAVATGRVRADVPADELLLAVARLCAAPGDEASGPARHMVAVLTDGLRCPAD